jgi:hypothetical protein
MMSEVTDALEEVVAIGELFAPGLFSEDLDGMMFDHPVRIEDYDDAPTIRSLK